MTPPPPISADQLEEHPEPIATTFDALGVPPELCEALAHAGIAAPFPVQAQTIPDGLAGRDLCGQARTGSGKTLAFGLPMLVRCARESAPRRPSALVLVPTRELALQVAKVLTPLGHATGVRVLAVYGGASLDPQIDAIAEGVDIVVATPGRLIDLVDRKAVQLSSIGILVVDEADRMADLGFTPQVEWILRHVPNERQTLLFSATLDGVAGHIIKSWMRDPVRHEMSEGRPTVHTMAHRFLYVHNLDKAKVVNAISAGKGKRTIIFCNTKRSCDRLTDELVKLGLSVATIHGDRRQADRERSLKRFSNGEINALVATDVAARGIDVEGIDVVVHAEPPIDVRTYLHRSGRTARAGADGVAVSLLEWNERRIGMDLMRRLGLTQPIPEVFSNDPRLDDLVSWDPAKDG